MAQIERWSYEGGHMKQTNKQTKGQSYKHKRREVLRNDLKEGLTKQTKGQSYKHEWR